MYKFENCFTKDKFVGTVDQLFFMIEGVEESIFCKSDVLKSYGWYWDESETITTN